MSFFFQIQVAYKYASKMRRLMLANRISQLAMDMQEKEEEEEEVTADPDARTDVESSADLFDTQLDFGGAEEQEETNPILAARSKKQGCDHVLKAVDISTLMQYYRTTSSNSICFGRINFTFLTRNFSMDVGLPFLQL